MRNTVLTIILMSSLTGFAQDDSVGIHGMALFRVGDQLIASHMPLVGGIHAHQVVLSIRAVDNHQHSAGDLRSFTAVVYEGHFERGGEPVTEPASFEIESILLSEPLLASPNDAYFWLPQGVGSGLLVHRIGDVPSFDQVILVTHSGERPVNELLTGAPTAPLTRDDTRWLTRHGLTWQKQLYLETADFVAGR